MAPNKQLINDLYWEQVRRARAMSGDSKVLEGLQLFDRSCRIMADGIRYQFPQASEQDVLRILRERLALARRLEYRT